MNKVVSHSLLVGSLLVAAVGFNIYAYQSNIIYSNRINQDTIKELPLIEITNEEIDDKANVIYIDSAPPIVEEEEVKSQYLELAERTSDEDMLLLAQMVEREYSYPCYDAKNANAQVAMNRALSPAWKGDTLREIISAPGQFSVYPSCKNATVSEMTDDAISGLLRGDSALERYIEEYKADGSIPEWVTADMYDCFATKKQSMAKYHIQIEKHYYGISKDYLKYIGKE